MANIETALSRPRHDHDDYGITRTSENLDRAGAQRTGAAGGSLDVTEALREKHSILELAGLGKEIGEGIDAQEYVNQLRTSGIIAREMPDALQGVRQIAFDTAPLIYCGTASRLF
jgi:hypothetical protein